MKPLKDLPLSILDLAPIQHGGTAADACAAEENAGAV